MPDARTPRRPWLQYVREGLLAFLGVGMLVLLVVAVFLPDELHLLLHGGLQAPSAAKTAGPSPSVSVPAPMSSPAVTINPEPAAVVLKLTDLPQGYHVLKAGPTLFTAALGESAPAGWDVVFAPDAPGQAGYLLIESVVAVYPNAAMAAAAVESEDAAEQAAHAARQRPIPGLASRQAAWIEPAPDRMGYGIVRITWQELNVVGQVGALGPISSSEPQQTALLAMVQQNRIRRRPDQLRHPVVAILPGRKDQGSPNCTWT
jgi:hypothetical protein